jgi:hypothetical protein
VAGAVDDVDDGVLVVTELVEHATKAVDINMSKA